MPSSSQTSRSQTAEARMTAVTFVTVGAQTSSNASTLPGNPKLSVAIRAPRRIAEDRGGSRETRPLSLGPPDLVCLEPSFGLGEQQDICWDKCPFFEFQSLMSYHCALVGRTTSTHQREFTQDHQINKNPGTSPGHFQTLLPSGLVFIIKANEWKVGFISGR